MEQEFIGLPLKPIFTPPTFWEQFCNDLLCRAGRDWLSYTTQAGLGFHAHSSSLRFLLCFTCPVTQHDLALAFIGNSENFSLRLHFLRWKTPVLHINTFNPFLCSFAFCCSPNTSRSSQLRQDCICLLLHIYVLLRYLIFLLRQLNGFPYSFAFDQHSPLNQPQH